MKPDPNYLDLQDHGDSRGCVILWSVALLCAWIALLIWAAVIAW